MPPLPNIRKAAFISWSAMGGYEYTAAVKSGRPNLVRWLFFLALGLYFTFPPGFARAAGALAFPLDFTSHTWTKQQGLPDDSVTSVLQTRDGYLWVGTSGGLARFDGVKFTIISPPNWKSNAPVAITALCEDSAGRLWVGTQDHGLLRCGDGIASPFSGNGTLHFQTVNSIAEGTAGDLWVGTPTGLVQLKGEASRRFTTKDGLPNDFISNVNVGRSGTVWITTRGGMCQFTNGQIEAISFQTESSGRIPESLGVYEDRRGQRWAYGDTYLVNLEDGNHLNHFRSGYGASTRIWSLCEGRNGELWIGASGKGLYCFFGEKFLLPSIYGELTSDVRAICQDRQGNLWLGTQGDGLVRLQPRTVRSLDASVGLPSRPARCLAFNPRGRAWIGFDRAGVYAGTAAGFEAFPSEALPNLQNLVSSVCVAPDSTVWVGTPGAGLYCIAKEKCLHLTTADGLSDNDVLSLAMDSDHAIWVGTSSGLQRMVDGVVATFGAAEGLPEEAVTAILTARNGGVWIGFGDGAVFRENRGQFHLASKSSAVQGRAVRALWEDSANRVWIGTEGGRLGCAVGDHFVSWDLPSGAADKSILGIITADDGDLWVETDNCIYCVAQKGIADWLSGRASLMPQQVFRADSVPDTGPGYGWPRALKSPDGTLWFAMENGVVSVDVAGTSVDVRAPPVVVEDIIVNKERLSPAQIKEAVRSTTSPRQAIRLPSNVGSLDINFTALDFSAPEKIRFRYRLEGLDPEWIVDADMARHARYSGVPYGTYTFHVQAGADQRWFDNEASFRIVIPTPLWRTPWALVTYSLAALALVGGVARLVSARRFRRRLAVLAAQQAMERERMRIARDMHDEIGSKLTKISFMSERAKRELSGQGPVASKLDSIAGTSRELLQTLDEIVWAVNPHNDTLEHLAAYLGQYATEYLQNTAVECELHIPRGLPHHPLSAEARHNLFLAFEESLNNALKHGRPTRVRVDMRLTESQFEIAIEDNGRGFDPAAFAVASGSNGTTSTRSRNGLRNMRQRLEMLGGRCEIRSHAGHGTTVTLTVLLTSETAVKSNGGKS